MTEGRGGWSQHLLPDAVVAFVDGELTPTACDRAASHIARCAICAAEISAQRQARAAVRAADTPPPPAGLLASLRAIPQEVELPATPDGLAVTDDGQLVTVQRPDRVAPLGSGQPFGSSPKLGEGKAVLGFRFGRRTVPNSSPRWRSAGQGAGVVVSGLVLGALALVNSGSSPVSDSGDDPVLDGRPAVNVEPAGLYANQLGVAAQR
ncbi:MAG TPA: zf-HC2 domain-containing protein [Actinophytocola sp.]|jgi:anti-sigma factor RsiW|uniref:zf-HC2 domain-containing protein n=1 Tax=Actinophytocola sp. TaxID=1872138 RepID=UPI002E08BAC3|nr:zf-HC2 domain-containing protein [Actinophytocola sp.]